MAKFGLGRGLADLEKEKGSVPDITILTGGERVVVKHIPLAQIGANPDQPRKTFDDAELQELANSIKERGVLQPILLRNVTGRPYLYEIVAGERRWRASKLAGLNEIPALVKTITNENAMEIALIENVQRENLNPMEEAAAYQNLMEKCGYDIADVSRLIGKSDSYIRNSIRLLSLPADVCDMVARGELSASHARTLTVADNAAEIAAEIVAGKLSVAETGRRVKNANRAPGARAHTSYDMSGDEIHDIESRIKAAIGADVTLIPRRGGAGRITITFKNRMHLMDIVDKISW